MNLHLDTLHKKPKVWNLLIVAAVTLAILIPLYLYGGDKEVPLGILITSLAFFVTTFLLIRAFFLQMRYNLYSYNTIIYFGFALFTLAAAVSQLLLFFQIQGLPAEVARANAISLLLGTASTYPLLTLPFLLVFSIALAISNISLIRHEGFRPVNVLGIVLALLLLGGSALIFALDYYATGSQMEVMVHDLYTNLLAAVYLYFECMLIGTIVAGGIAARVVPPMDRDYIIVLGCAIRRDGTPTPLLRGRLDRALQFAETQQAATGKAPVFVLSGGQGSDECISEAESMRRYLEGKGIDEERMILEDKSVDTLQNMRFSKEKIFAVNPEAKVAFSTTNYHVFRAGLKSRRVKMRSLGMGCRSKWYFWPNAAVREFAGLMTQHIGKQALILLSMLIFYASLTILHYLYDL